MLTEQAATEDYHPMVQSLAEAQRVGVWLGAHRASVAEPGTEPSSPAPQATVLTRANLPRRWEAQDQGAQEGPSIGV